MVRGRAIVAALAVVAGGCGGGDAAPGRPAAVSVSPPSGESAAAAASHAPVLVSFIQQRPGALIDKVTVRTDGSGVFDRPSGGVGRVLREIEIDRAALDELRVGFRDVPRRLPRGRGALAPNGATYIVRFGTRTVVARQGQEPARLRKPIELLAAILVGDHVRKVLGEQVGGVAGATHTTGIGKAKKARELVFFQRQGAAGATLDTISVRVDGTATHEKRYGGAGGRFKELVLRHGSLAKLRRVLAQLPSRDSLARGTPPPGGAVYIMRYRGRTLAGRAGAIAPAARPAVELLDHFIDGEDVKVTRTRQTHTPG
jgi:hypothetical protein